MIPEEIYLHGSLEEFAKQLRKDVSSAQCEGSLVGDINIDRNTNKLSEYLNKTNLTQDPQNVSNQTIQHGTELFLYLNACQSSKEFVRNYWEIFFEFLFTEYLSSDQKVLSLLKIIKDKRSKDGQHIANTIMARLSEVLGFKFNIAEVSRKGIIGRKVTWKNTIRNITGIHTTQELRAYALGSLFKHKSTLIGHHQGSY